jgi:predicted Fe-S protein YdhL (DUF1289 family)
MSGIDDLDNLTAEDLACAGLHRVVDGFEDWSIFTVAERHELLIAAVAQNEALKRRERRREEARQIRLVKAAQKAGLQVKRAVIDGVTVEFGQPEAIPATPPPLDELETTEQLRSLM